MKKIISPLLLMIFYNFTLSPLLTWFAHTPKVRDALVSIVLWVSQPEILEAMTGIIALLILLYLNKGGESD